MTIELLTEQTISNLQLQLVAQQQTLKLQLLESDDASRPVTLDQQSVGRISRIDAIQQQQMATANRSQSIALLLQIDTALKRIELDQYGQCQICDEPIALARLQARPHTPNCILCQSKQEVSG